MAHMTDTRIARGDRAARDARHNANRKQKREWEAAKAKRQAKSARARAKAIEQRPTSTPKATAHANGHGQPLRKLFTLTPAIDRALRRRAAVKALPEVMIVRNALREYLGVDERPEHA